MNILKRKGGNTLILVLGFIIIFVLMITPLIMSLNVGLLQTATNGHAEIAFDEAESAAVIFKRLFNEAAKKTNLDQSDVTALANQLNNAQLFPNLKIESLAETGEKGKVRFLSTSGKGQQTRGKVLELAYQTEEKSGESSSRDVFYWRHGVVISNDEKMYNHIFENKGSPNPDYIFINNAYDSEKYTREFNDYMATYIGDNFNKRFNERRLPSAPLAVPGRPFPDSAARINRELLPAREISNKVTEPSPYVYTSAGKGISYSGDIYLTKLWSAYDIAAFSNKLALDSSGNIVMDGYSANTRILGNLRVGKDFKTSSGNLYVDGDAWIRGNTDLGKLSSVDIKGDLLIDGNLTGSQGGSSFIVNGNLIVGGKIDMGGLNQFKVQGDLIVQGDVSFSGSVSDLQVGGNMVVEGKTSFNGNGTMNIKGSLQVGNSLIYIGSVSGLTVGQSIWVGNELTFSQNLANFKTEGSLSVVGAANFNSISTFQVVGSFVTGSNLTFNSNINNLDVKGVLSGKGLIKFSSVGSISVGRWTTDDFDSGVIANGDNSSIYAGGGIETTSAFTFIRATGELHVTSFTQNSQIARLKLGGSFLTGGNVTFQSSLTDWQIGGQLSVGGKVDINSMQKMSVAGNVFAGGGLTLNDISVGFKVGGSILTPEQITFKNTFSEIRVTGDVISSTSKIIFEKPCSNLFVGSLVAKLDIEFSSTVTSFEITKDLIASGDIKFNNTVSSNVIVEGMVAALKNINFGINMGDGMRLGGFYAGGVMIATDNFTGPKQWYNPSGGKFIKIYHNPPTPVTKIKKIEFTNWNSRATYGQP